MWIAMLLIFGLLIAWGEERSKRGLHEQRTAEELEVLRRGEVYVRDLTARY